MEVLGRVVSRGIQILLASQYIYMKICFIMAQSKTTSPPIICIFCTQVALVRRDKYNRPYIACPSCGSHFFFRTPLCEVAYFLMMDLLRANWQWYTTTLQARYTQKAIAIQEHREVDVSMPTSPTKKHRAPK